MAHFLEVLFGCLPFTCLLRASVTAQGGIDGGGHENPMTAAVRELKEETGISSARIVALVSPRKSTQVPLHLITGVWSRASTDRCIVMWS